MIFPDYYREKAPHPVLLGRPCLRRREAGAHRLAMRSGTLALLAAAAVWVSGCGGTANDTGSPEALEIRGVVTAVEARSFDEVESLTIQDDSGAVWVFEDVGAIDFTPSHLRQHMALGEPVTVRFHREAGGPVIDGIGD